jgi:hypothetical protein
MPLFLFSIQYSASFCVASSGGFAGPNVEHYQAEQIFIPEEN